ncbi:MAG TPA: class I adenylate-forming enzyme family protein [Steroidobacteraceae bacterium]|jgi:acyl-CoA synthetase (AMP-forming)/AMP-acid ligase II|nr:class I adenylate-forming enzyme family protein [Steroidobacteraceae bacterium]
MRFTVAEQVEAVARAFPDRVVVEMVGGRSYTYRQLIDRMERLAAALGDVPSGRNGPMVAVLLSNGVDSLLSYLACQLRGLATVPINTRLAPAEMGYILQDSDATVLLSGGDQLARAKAIAAEYGQRLVNCDEISDAADPLPRAQRARAEGGDTAVVFYTSGTTGFPKGAAITYDCWAERLMWWGWEFDIASTDVMLVPGPTFHMSFCSLCLCALYRGAQLRIVERFDVPKSFEELRDNCSWSLLIPTMTMMLLELWREGGRKPLPAARILLSSGAALSPSTLEDMMQAFPNARIYEAYGWTEGGWVTSEIKKRGTIVPHSVGWSAFGSEVVVLDDDGKVCAPGTVGEVAARTPVHFSHYLNNPGATRKAWAGDYQKSGDVGTFLEDGRLKLLDRRNDMILTGGENVYSSEVERVLNDHPTVAECVVVGQPDPRWGSAVVGVVVARPGARIDEEELRAFCRAQLAGYKCPKRFVVLDALPRNSMGKVEKFRVRAELAGAPPSGERHSA